MNKEIKEILDCFLEIKNRSVTDEDFEKEILLLTEKYTNIIEKRYSFGNLSNHHVYALLSLLNDFSRGVYDTPHPMSQMRRNAIAGAKRFFG